MIRPKEHFCLNCERIFNTSARKALRTLCCQTQVCLSCLNDCSKREDRSCLFCLRPAVQCQELQSEVAQSSPADRSTSSPTACPLHAREDLDRVCFAEACPDSFKELCPLCLKERHRDCDSRLMVRLRDFEVTTRFGLSDQELAELSTRVVGWARDCSTRSWAEGWADRASEVRRMLAAVTRSETPQLSLADLLSGRERPRASFDCRDNVLVFRSALVESVLQLDEERFRQLVDGEGTGAKEIVCRGQGELLRKALAGLSRTSSGGLCEGEGRRPREVTSCLMLSQAKRPTPLPLTVSLSFSRCFPKTAPLCRPSRGVSLFLFSNDRNKAILQTRESQLLGRIAANHEAVDQNSAEGKGNPTGSGGLRHEERELSRPDSLSHGEALPGVDQCGSGEHDEADAVCNDSPGCLGRQLDELRVDSLWKSEQNEDISEIAEDRRFPRQTAPNRRLSYHGDNDWPVQPLPPGRRTGLSKQDPSPSQDFDVDFFKSFQRIDSELTYEDAPPPKWLSSSAVVAEEHGGCVSLRRSPLFGSQGWHYAVSDAELTLGSAFEVTITGIRAENRYMPLGVVDEFCLQSILRSDFQEKLSARAHWTSGYTKSLSMTGRMATSSRTDDQGFRVGSRLYLCFSPEERCLTVVDQDQNYMLKSTPLDPRTRFFMFVQLVFPESACEIRRLRGLSLPNQ